MNELTFRRTDGLLLTVPEGSAAAENCRALGMELAELEPELNGHTNDNDDADNPPPKAHQRSKRK